MRARAKAVTPGTPGPGPDPAQAAAGAAKQLQRRAIAGALMSSAAVLVGLPVSLLANIVAARYLQPEGVGVLALATSLFVFSGFSDLGTPVALTQWGAAAVARDDPRQARRLLSDSLAIRLALQLPVMVALGVVLLHSEPGWMLGVYAGAVLLGFVSSGGQLALMSHNRSLILARIGLVASIGSQAAGAIAAVITRDPLPVWLARIGASALLLSAVLLVLSSKEIRAVLRPRSPLHLGRRFWTFALSMWIATLAATLVFSRTEIFVLQVYHQTAAVGLFAVAFGLAAQLTAPIDAMSGALAPASGALLAAHPGLATAALGRGLRFSALGSGAMLASAAPAVAIAIPTLYGASFTASTGLFWAMAVISTFQTSLQPVNALLIARRRGRVVIVAGLVALVADVGLALALAPAFGAWGAVVANAAGQVIGLGLYLRAELSHHPTGGRATARALRPWTCGLVAGTAAMVLGLQAANSIEAIALAVVVGTLGFAGLVRLSGGALTADDTRALESAAPAFVAPLLRRLAPLAGLRS